MKKYIYLWFLSMIICFHLINTILFASENNLLMRDNSNLRQSTLITSSDEHPCFTIKIIGSERANKDYDRDKIKTIKIVSNISIPSDAIDSWDVSENQDGSVILWLMKNEETSRKYIEEYDMYVDINDVNNTMYDMYIGCNNKIMVKDASCLFSNYINCCSISGLELLDFSQSNDMYAMFYNCKNLTELNLSTFNTRNVEDMWCMFESCSNLEKLDLSTFDTSKVRDMSCMFSNCEKLEEINLISFDTSNVVYMSGMFRHCKKIGELNLSKFNTNNVLTMFGMFEYCSSLTKLDLDNFYTNALTNMGCMFYECTNLKYINLINFNLSNVIDTRLMFSGCEEMVVECQKENDIEKLKSAQGTSSSITFKISEDSNLESVEYSDTVVWYKNSDWATIELNKANELGIIPAIFNNQDLTQNITRKEFAHIAVKLWEKVSGQTVVAGPKNPFVDTEDIEVLKAYNLDITKGTSETTFEPDELITREQMATMMTRALTKAGINTSADLNIAGKFSDDSKMHDWGKEAIYYMSNIEIIKGIGNNIFDVLGNATREQALLISERSAEKFAK